MKVAPLSDEWFREKAGKFHDEWGVDGQYDAIYLLLKEVSRDTCHACAEVRAKHTWGPDELFAIEVFNEGQDAHANACMNVGGKL